MRMLLAAVFGLAGLASVAHAATLIGVNGQVLVNRGHGFVLAQPGQELAPGDILVANPGASAQISYPEGCVSPLSAGDMVSIPPKAPCGVRAKPGPEPTSGIGSWPFGGG